ncbi:phosphoribosylglycinamide formyltransferase [Ornithinimicrobium faecis]|uniref:Phosphoribosylglycinamide formyltransferase n=1 Tax=Ornithinimicrobium faecis TaxID=2934158 RepID=A0ABY4YQ19_9MICO|nr:MULTISPECIES: phosphoribosylglycinamide formyltransferase [unclassified Ornithinimicrobium]USQ78794.1 phosphoribosylglycinamide formyltransferase [Ornithinimicrobium sp. HY1793]
MPTSPTPPSAARVVVLVSGTGSNLQALIDAATDPAYGVQVVAVGADRHGARALERAVRHGIPTFVCRVPDHRDRQAWDAALAEQIGAHTPDLVVSAGFMKILGEAVLSAHTVVNTHPALLPAFPGAHAVADALAYGVRVTGCTAHLVDSGVDTGPILEQVAVPVEDGDTPESLHERIKTVERSMLVDVVGRLARHGHTLTDRKVTIP